MCTLCNSVFNILIITITFEGYHGSYRKYTPQNLVMYREEVRKMFNHAYSGYLNYAYPYDELRPLTCDGMDTWGSYSLTLIDALDTLIVMGNYTEFKRVVSIITKTVDFDSNTNVSVFETNIRVIGGLLSAHILSHKADMDLEPGWPCTGPLLQMAVNVADRLLPAFDTPTGMPFGTVNLKYGVPADETTITCTAGIGTFIVEFGSLSRLTGDPIYENVAMNALRSLFKYQSKIGLMGNHINVMNGVWTSQDSGIGAGVDSYFEYLVKGGLLFNKPELISMFSILEKPINQYLKHNDWFFWASMQKGLITLPLFQSLEAFWPGLLSMIGRSNDSIGSIHNYYSVWKKYGFTPEFYNIIHQEVSSGRESYPLRPEFIESIMYLYRISRDPYFLDIGVSVLKSIQFSSKTPCGYATIKDCRDHSLDNRMESFFLAETTKYLYLLFDNDNFIHSDGRQGKVRVTNEGRKCVIDSGGYVFNTEAHPIDPGVFACCTKKENIDDGIYEKNLHRVLNKIDILKKFNHHNTIINSIIINDFHTLYKLLEINHNVSPKKCSYFEWLSKIFLMQESFDNKYLQKGEHTLNFKRNQVLNDYKSYLTNKSLYIGEGYDVQKTLESILWYRSEKTNYLFCDLKLLYCNPQPFAQRLSVYGQIIGDN